MKNTRSPLFAQFYQFSTGYVEGTIPPVFREEAKKPIPACGSSGIMRLDARKSLALLAGELVIACKARGYIGFTIERGGLLNSRIVHPLQVI